MSPAGTVEPTRPPTETIEVLWQELVEEVRRVLREVEEEEAQARLTCTLEERRDDH